MVRIPGYPKLRIADQGQADLRLLGCMARSLSGSSDLKSLLGGSGAAVHRLGVSEN